jgi:hypothetical protein
MTCSVRCAAIAVDDGLVLLSPFDLPRRLVRHRARMLDHRCEFRPYLI